MSGDPTADGAHAARLELATEAHDRGDLAAAERLCLEILEGRGDGAGALNLLGVIRCKTGDPQEGLKLIARACAAEPDEVSYLNNLGTAFTSLEHWEQALVAYRRVLELDPRYAAGHNNIGTVLRKLAQPEAAAGHFETACRLRPDYAEAYSNHANALIDLDRIDEAARALETAIRLRPDYAVAYNNLSIARQRQGRYGEAEAAARRAVDLDPGFADPYCNLGEILKESGRAAEAIRAYRTALSLEPGRQDARSNMVFAMNCLDDLPQPELLAAHRAWAVHHGGKASADHANDTDPERRLRVGYVSFDFRRHSCSYFFESLLDGHDRGAVHVTCYSNVLRDDAVTARLKGKADAWRDIRGVSDDQAAAMIRDDGIDILVDLSGHTMGNRLRLFSLKPAPVAVTYLGYPATTGLDAIDYRFTDARADPPGLTEAYHTEELVRLDGGFLCYRPPEDAPAVAPPSALANGFVTFGSCNNLAKVTPRVIEAWAEILAAVPGSRLLLKAKAMGDAGVQDSYRRAFSERGVDPGRLDLVAWIDSGSHLAIYDRIDIALDPFPYNGTTTICETMWSGVPTVVLEGAWHAARVGVSLLGRIGHDDLIAPDPETYVETAVRWAGDLDKLAAERQGMRARIAASGLIDAPAFAGHVEAAHRDMWRRWCAGVRC